MIAVTIRWSYGYGILGINLLENSTILYSTLERNNENSNTENCWSLSLTNKTEAIKCQGGNALFIFADLPECPIQPTTYQFIVQQSKFNYGLNLVGGQQKSATPYPTFGSGFALEMSQQNYGVKVNLTSSSFSGNSATKKGANIHVAVYNTVVNSSITIETCSSSYGNFYFPSQNEKLFGGSPGLYFSHGIIDKRFSQNETCKYNSKRSEKQKREVVLFIENSIFSYNKGGGILLSFSGFPTLDPNVMQVVRTAVIKGSLLSRNKGFSTASLLVLDESIPGLGKPAELLLDNVEFTHNKLIHSADFLSPKVDAIISLQPFSNTRFISMNNVTIHRCTFAHNDFSAISSLKSHLYFEKHNTFKNNTALTGGAIYLTRDSIAYLRPKARMVFENNHATRRGGAIYISGGTDSPDTITLGCPIQVYDPTLLPTTELGIEMRFINNTATQAGDAVYGGGFDVCAILAPSGFLYHNATIFGNATFDFVTNFTGQPKSISLVSSDAIDVCYCTKDQYDCITRNRTISKYPGETFEVSLIGLGQRYGSVPTVINTYSSVNKTRQFRSTGRECSDVSYLVASNRTFEYLIATAERTSIQHQPVLIVVYLLPCPVGFDLDNTTQKCKCDAALKQRNMTQCDINNRAINRLPPYWLSNYSDNLLLHDHCPYDYCKTTPVQITMQEPNISKQCAFNRTGTLCGHCKEGLSLVFGTSRCLPCSNKYLALFLAFAVAGIALVVFLFLLELTVSIGTINGLIFYANIVKINEAVFFPPGDSTPLKVFVSWVNLDLGIETCFFDGMNSYAKTWLQFVFPLYMWLILVVIIIGARHSVTLSHLCGSHAVQVLATIFLLSFTKLLRVITTALSLTTLDYPDGPRVLWLYDGNVEYGKQQHIALLFVSIFFLVSLVPYTLLLTIAQYLRKKSHKKGLRWVSRNMPVFDAYLGPYKDNYGHWTGLLLLVRVILVLVFVFNIFGDPAVNLLVITLVVFFLITLNLGQGGMYKNNYLTALELSFMINLGVLAAVTSYTRQTGGNQKAAIYTSTSIALATFAAIMIYHACIKIHTRWRRWKASRTPEEYYEPLELLTPPPTMGDSDDESCKGDKPTETVIEILPEDSLHTGDSDDEATPCSEVGEQLIAHVNTV